MINFLVSKCIPNYKAVEDMKVRSAYGRLAGILGVVSNLLLFALKLFAGIVSGSVAVLSDAFNNLSDVGSSVVALIGLAAAGRHADEEHPFGHGRFEYVAALIVSFIIMLVGFELLKTSVGKILHYEALTFGWWPLGILVFSILSKLWLFIVNHKIAKIVDSVVIRAAAQDSLNDVYATGAVLVSMLLGLAVKAPVDGIMGACVSVFIMFSGFGIAKDTITILLGTPPDPAMAEEICRRIMERDCISGVHDLIIHDYGPGRCMASIHAEVPENGDIVKVHEVIDDTEKAIQREMGVHVVIHMDPISVSDERIDEVRALALACARQYNPDFGIHDFRMTDGESCINLIFDLEVPYSLTPEEREKAAKHIRQALKAKDERYNAVIQVENTSWQAKS